MTATPERNRNLKSPIRNPRIPTPSSPPKPPMNYQSKDFINLLDSDDDTDHDVDIFNNDENNENKNKNQNKPSIANKKITRKTPSKQFLKTLEESSPEMSDEEKDHNNNHRQHLLNKQKYHHHQQKQASFSADDQEEESDDEFDNASDSDTQSNSPNIDNYDDNDRNRTRYQDGMRSRSRSGSNIRKRNIVSNTNTTLRSKSKPKYQRYERSNPNVRNPNVSNPADITYIINRAKYKPTTKPLPTKQPIIQQQVIKQQPSIKDLSADLDLHDDLNRIAKPSTLSQPINNAPPIETKPITTKSRMYEYYVSFATLMLNIWYYITWLPRKIWKLLTFLLEHWIYFSLMIVIILLLYSPTKKLINQSIDFGQITDELLQSLNLREKIIYCDSCDNKNGNICELYIDEDCRACPENGHCFGGKFWECKGDRTLIDGKCVYDPNEKRNLLDSMRINTINLLSQTCGEYQCQKYSLYKLVYSINRENGNIMRNKGLSEKLLSKKLSKLLGLQEESHLFGQVFQEHLQNIKDATKEGSLYGNDLLYDSKNKYYYSNKPSKSLSCHLIILLSDNAYIITPIILIGSIISILWINRKKRLLKKLRAKQLTQDKKEQVIEILKNYLLNTNEEWIAILPIQKQIMGHTNKCKEWDRVEREVDKDPSVQKSLQMKDGLQKLCWKLLDRAIVN